MKVSMVNNSSKNVFGLSGRQARYVISRSKRPEAMKDYLMGNWFTSAIKAVGTGISTGISNVGNVIKSVTTGSSGVAVAVVAPIAQNQVEAAKLEALEKERVALVEQQKAEELKLAQQAAAIQPQIQTASLPATTSSTGIDFSKIIPIAAIAIAIPLLLSGE